MSMILTRPAHRDNQTTSSHTINHIRKTSPTVASLNTRAPRSRGTSKISTKGIIYVKYRTRTEDPWTLTSY